MASKRGMNLRNEAAQGRIDVALAALVDGPGIDLPAMPARSRDPILNEAIRLEWTADVLEAIAASSGAPDPAEGDEGGDPASADNDLMAHTRDDLNAIAADLGIEDAASLPNKGAVADAITTAKGN